MDDGKRRGNALLPKKGPPPTSALSPSSFFSLPGASGFSDSLDGKSMRVYSTYMPCTGHILVFIQMVFLPPAGGASRPTKVTNAANGRPTLSAEEEERGGNLRVPSVVAVYSAYYYASAVYT